MTPPILDRLEKLEKAASDNVYFTGVDDDYQNIILTLIKVIRMQHEALNTISKASCFSNECDYSPDGLPMESAREALAESDKLLEGLK